MAPILSSRKNFSPLNSTEIVEAIDNSSDVTRVLCKVQLRMPSHAGGRWPTAGWGDLIIMRFNILKERSRSLRKNMTIAEKK